MQTLDYTVLTPLALGPWLLAGTPVSGGQPVSGPPQTGDAAGGGWWTLSLPFTLAGPAEVLAWNRMIGNLRAGDGKMIVPCLEALAYVPDVAPVTTPVLSTDAFMPAYPAPTAPPTQLKIDAPDGPDFDGLLYLSLTSVATGLTYLHQIVAVTDVTGTVTTLTVMPPLREDFDAGSEVEVMAPAATMKLDPAGIAQTALGLSPGFIGNVQLSLAETFS